MSTLTGIEGLSSDECELLEAAGWSNREELAGADAENLSLELGKANGVLRLLEELPDLEKVRGWIDAAGRIPELEEENGVEPELLMHPVDYEADPDVQEMISQAPVAVPLPNRSLAERGIRPTEIRIAPVLNRAASDLEIRVTARRRRKATASASAPARTRGSVVQIADFAPGGRSKPEVMRLKKLEDVQAQTGRARKGRSRAEREAHAMSEAEKRLVLLKAPREETNRGKNPNSRFYIRGVLHTQPLRVWFGALAVILFQIALPLAFIAAPLLMLSDQMPDKFAWVPKWFLVFPLSVPVTGLAYLLISTTVRCRVCTQKLLTPRHCRKNKKAHHVPGLGYIMPLAFHVLFFKWFNCMFCGTSVRIKE